MKNQKTKKLVVKLAVSALAVAVVSYLLYQVISVLSAPYKTVLCTQTTVTDSVSADGIAIRNEAALGGSQGVGYSYQVADGFRVSAGEVIAYIYANEAHAEKIQRLNSLRAERDMLIALQNSAAGTADILQSKNELYTAISRFSQGYSNNIDTKQIKLALASYYRQASREADYGSRIAGLNTLISSLEISQSEPPLQLTAPHSGYVITHCDGFEGLISGDDVFTVTIDQLEGVMTAPIVHSSTPKLTDGFVWYFAVIVDSEYAARLRTGDHLSLDFTYSGGEEIPARIVRTDLDSEKGKLLVIFELDRFNSSTAGLRLETVKINFRSYTGVTVPRSALRMENGQTGVYIKFGNVVRFVTIDPVFENDSFILSAAQAGGSSGKLRLYDEIIVEGRDLYVGKQLD